MSINKEYMDNVFKEIENENGSRYTIIDYSARKTFWFLMRDNETNKIEIGFTNSFYGRRSYYGFYDNTIHFVKNLDIPDSTKPRKYDVPLTWLKKVDNVSDDFLEKVDDIRSTDKKWRFILEHLQKGDSIVIPEKCVPDDIPNGYGTFLYKTGRGYCFELHGKRFRASKNRTDIDQTYKLLRRRVILGKLD
jgi:hypothetical protein